MAESERIDATNDEDRWAAVRDLPPSAKLVAKTLEYEGRLTQQELAEQSRLPPRTVRYALTRLQEIEAVETQFAFDDARKRYYVLAL